MGQRGEGWGRSKSDEEELCKPLRNFGFCSACHLTRLCWLLGEEKNIRQGWKQGELFEGMAVTR